METTTPAASPPFGGGVPIETAEIMTIDLPRDPAQIRHQMQRLELHLNLLSEELSTRDIDIDFTINVTAHTTNTSMHALMQGLSTTNRNSANAATSRINLVEHPDPIADAPEPDPPAGSNIVPESSTDEVGGETRSVAVQCKVCMDDLTHEIIVTLNCGCLYCVECLNAHIKHSLSSRSYYPARCCSQIVIDIKNVEPYLSSDVLGRWSKVEAEFSERVPMYCGDKLCSAHIPIYRLTGVDKFILCTNCHTDTCKECKQWRYHHGGDEMDACPEDIVSTEDRALANVEKWKQCPGCKNLVERTEGCNHMQCECNTEFCYDCGDEFSPDHRCGCHTIPDADGYHHRPGEPPNDEANPRDGRNHAEWIDIVANRLYRADREGHDRFENGQQAGIWLWEEDEEVVLWDRLTDQEEVLAFDAYERIRQDHNPHTGERLQGRGNGEEGAPEGAHDRAGDAIGTSEEGAVLWDDPSDNNDPASG